MSYQNNQNRQTNYQITTTNRSIPFDDVIGEKMGYQNTNKRPQTPIKNLHNNDKRTQEPAYNYQKEAVTFNHVNNYPKETVTYNVPNNYTKEAVAYNYPNNYIKGAVAYNYPNNYTKEAVAYKYPTEPVTFNYQKEAVLVQPPPYGYTQTISGFEKTNRPRIAEYIVDGKQPPAPQRRVEFVPYQQKYIDYVEQKQMVPVQKAYTDYYQIEHIIDYVPVERQQYTYVTEEQERVNYKLQYLPVEQKIIHFTEENARYFGYNQKDVYVKKDMTHTFQPSGQPQRYMSTVYQVEPEIKEFQPRKSRTNFVTTEGYDPNENIRTMNKVLAESAARSNSRVIT